MHFFCSLIWTDSFVKVKRSRQRFRCTKGLKRTILLKTGYSPAILIAGEYQKTTARSSRYDRTTVRLPFYLWGGSSIYGMWFSGAGCEVFSLGCVLSRRKIPCRLKRRPLMRLAAFRTGPPGHRLTQCPLGSASTGQCAGSAECASAGDANGNARTPAQGCVCRRH